MTAQWMPSAAGAVCWMAATSKPGIAKPPANSSTRLRKLVSSELFSRPLRIQ